nr:MAG TPA: hypothetical protein [Caudoviricetes sp.]
MYKSINSRLSSSLTRKRSNHRSCSFSYIPRAARLFFYAHLKEVTQNV